MEQVEIDKIRDCYTFTCDITSSIEIYKIRHCYTFTCDLTSSIEIYKIRHCYTFTCDLTSPIEIYKIRHCYTFACDIISSIIIDKNMHCTFLIKQNKLFLYLMYLELNIVVQVGVVMISQTLTLKSCKISGLKYLVMLRIHQGCNARKVNCGRVYSAYILKPVLFERNL